MKLLHTISIRLLVLTTVVLSFWALFFYFAMMNEINDEVDDSLEDYAEAKAMLLHYGSVRNAVDTYFAENPDKRK